MLALGVNGTAIMAALPTIRHDLGLTDSELEWAINAYLLVSAACIIPGGKAGDRFGSRRVAGAGLALFAVASAVVAISQEPIALLSGRALQGLAAALAVPGTLTTISENSAPDRRASAIGAWAGFLMLGFSLGPLIGGAFTHYLDWRTIFWASGACMLVATAGYLGAGQANSPPRMQHAAPLDLTGFLLLAIFMVALVSALHALPTIREAPLTVGGLAVLAVGTLVALQKVERRAADPLIDLGVFSQPAFVRAVLLAAIAMSCILSLLLFYNLAAQSPSGLAMTAIGAGLSLLPMSGGLLILAFCAPSLNRRFGPRRTLITANVLIAAAGIAIALAAAARNWVLLAIGLFAIGVGLALPYATAPRLALASLPPDRAGSASGIINACTFLGGSIGVAVGAVAFAFGGFTAAMVLIVLLGLVGAWFSRTLPATA